MLCQSCKQRTATIHLTEIANNQRTETHLCQECAQEQGLTVKTQVPLNDLLNTLLSAQAQAAGSEPESPGREHACPECGMTLKRFAKESLLGCPQDYKEFHDELMPLIEKNQNGKSTHAGKLPSHMPPMNRRESELISLQRKLEQAIRNEDYETAAALRDQIRAYS
ncbi:MAG: UvrB/UvrC motif-containing protein [Planctomycetaceae bacterium]|nr:UvrB/UvrC motif-containing protein [Planctomycetaceae bacterium]